jgi:hypothetical protein
MSGIQIAGVAMTVMSAFPGHAGRAVPLLRWRSVARIGDHE